MVVGCVPHRVVQSAFVPWCLGESGQCRAGRGVRAPAAHSPPLRTRASSSAASCADAANSTTGASGRGCEVIRSFTFGGTAAVDAAVAIQAAVWRRNERTGRGCQPAGLAAVRGTGLMWAKALRAFQVGKARTSHEGPWRWMRRSRMASAQASWPACHLTKASASAAT
jgi:hypothetical protein